MIIVAVTTTTIFIIIYTKKIYVCPANSQKASHGGASRYNGKIYFTFSITVSSRCTILPHPFPANCARLAVKTRLRTKLDRYYHVIRNYPLNNRLHELLLFRSQYNLAFTRGNFGLLCSFSSNLPRIHDG